MHPRLSHKTWLSTSNQQNHLFILNPSLHPPALFLRSRTTVANTSVTLPPRGNGGVSQDVHQKKRRQHGRTDVLGVGCKWARVKLSCPCVRDVLLLLAAMSVGEGLVRCARGSLVRVNGFSWYCPSTAS